MSQERVLIAVEDHVAIVTLNRAEKHNALDIPMFEALVSAAASVSRTPGVRAVVLHGDGPSFCSGLDVMSVMSSSSDGTGLTTPLEEHAPGHFSACWEAARVAGAAS